jgi:hypothetical protein
LEFPYTVDIAREFHMDGIPETNEIVRSEMKKPPEPCGSEG